MKIAGSGSISQGEYNEEISVSGAGKLNGNVKCESFKASGSVKAFGDVVCDKEFNVSGSARIEGAVTADSVKISGLANVGKSVTVKGEARVSGSLTVGGGIKASKIKSSGAIKVSSEIEAEEAVFEGTLESGGLINADKVTVKLERGNNKVLSIGGSEVKVCVGKTAAFVNRIPLVSKIVSNKIATLTVEESIEGDTVVLEAVKAPLVVGKSVKIGDGCEIELVKYIDCIDISPKSKVLEYKKID